MKGIGIPQFAIAIAVAVALIIPVAARAQDPSETLFNAKCAGCHGVRGAGSAIGKRLGAHDFRTATVQGMSDAELSAIIGDGKDKMPAYGKSLKAEDIKGLVAYIRSLKE
jgi:mono/diheme cytochrome c family protein